MDRRAFAGLMIINLMMAFGNTFAASFNMIYMPETKVKLYILRAFNFLFDIRKERKPIWKINNGPHGMLIEPIIELILFQEGINPSLLIYNCCSSMTLVCLHHNSQLLYEIENIRITILIDIAASIA